MTQIKILMMTTYIIASPLLGSQDTSTVNLQTSMKNDTTKIFSGHIWLGEKAAKSAKENSAGKNPAQKKTSTCTIEPSYGIKNPTCRFSKNDHGTFTVDISVKSYFKNNFPVCIAQGWRNIDAKVTLVSTHQIWIEIDNFDNKHNDFIAQIICVGE